MQPPAPDPAALRAGREWQDRAERDLEAARQLLGGSPPFPDIAVYHAQQAAEKALKAYLTACGATFRRTHDLVELLGQCQGLDGRFGQLAAAAQMLTPYASRFRYPGGPLTPPVAEAKQAIVLAATIVTFVRQQL